MYRHTWRAWRSASGRTLRSCTRSQSVALISPIPTPTSSDVGLLASGSGSMKMSARPCRPDGSTRPFSNVSRSPASCDQPAFSWASNSRPLRRSAGSRRCRVRDVGVRRRAMLASHTRVRRPGREGASKPAVEHAALEPPDAPPASAPGHECATLVPPTPAPPDALTPSSPVTTTPIEPLHGPRRTEPCPDRQRARRYLRLAGTLPGTTSGARDLGPDRDALACDVGVAARLAATVVGDLSRR